MSSSDYVEQVASNLEGLDFVSVSACAGCEECNLPVDPSDEQVDLANESHFSWRPCDACGSHLGGDRHPAHGRLGGASGDLVHLDICHDCVFYLAYGTTPD